MNALKLLDGVIDIYMPDMKYASAQLGLRYSKVRDYPFFNQLAVKEMHRQTGDLEIDSKGLAVRGLLVRHLVLPNNVAGTDEVFRFLSEEISANTYLNLMDQYRPSYNAHHFQRINRPLKSEEYRAAVRLAHEASLNRLDNPRYLW
jgi:putative pyruvate formate lyase activating enzyme